jgi:hypothetical protein
MAAKVSPSRLAFERSHLTHSSLRTTTEEEASLSSSSRRILPNSSSTTSSRDSSSTASSSSRASVHVQPRCLASLTDAPCLPSVLPQRSPAVVPRSGSASVPAAVRTAAAAAAGLRPGSTGTSLSLPRVPGPLLIASTHSLRRPEAWELLVVAVPDFSRAAVLQRYESSLSLAI